MKRPVPVVTRLKLIKNATVQNTGPDTADVQGTSETPGIGACKRGREGEREITIQSFFRFHSSRAVPDCPLQKRQLIWLNVTVIDLVKGQNVILKSMRTGEPSGASGFGDAGATRYDCFLLLRCQHGSCLFQEDDDDLWTD
jgi:hypothetical protein